MFKKTSILLHAIDLAMGTQGKNDRLAKDHIHVLADWAIFEICTVCSKVLWWCILEKMHRCGEKIFCRRAKKPSDDIQR